MKYTFTTRRDNYEVPRGYIRGRVSTEFGPDKKTDVLSFEGMAWPKGAEKALYLLDFGTRVEIRYVTGWNETNSCLYLQPFPLSVGTRPDNGRPIDMSGWMLGPRVTFHLKLKEDNPYVRGEVTSQGVRVKGGQDDNETCECCLRTVWCGGWSVCFECRMNDCESVHADLNEEGE